MAEYIAPEIEAKWQQYWKENNTYAVSNNSEKPKYYVLDMFPYPSGAGLHVGHPLGYIASDIVSRYKRLKGFNVLHPMGFDAFGLPAEQYAIETGQHPAITTEKNLATFKSQLDKIGFTYDWDREIQTCSPEYYKWTQWIFMQLFNSWFSLESNKAEDITLLINQFEQEGNTNAKASCSEEAISFTAAQWNAFSEKEQQEILLDYRLTFLAEAVVNWCPELGTVLANDEVKDGFSERGGHPVERKKMKQWMMRITAYADRLGSNLDKLDWSDSLKEVQKNWIGKSYGCELDFRVKDSDIKLTAFTTRVDTIYGVTYVVLAPEHELVAELTTDAQKAEVEAYVHTAKNRSERERMADVKTVSGVFTGNYVINPFSGKEAPLYIADYVLAGYGTGVVMAVPASDDRDNRFAKHFDLPIVHVIEGTETLEDPTEKKKGKMINSDFLNGIDSEKAAPIAIEKAVELGVGIPKVNYKIRDAVFSRQRYWGEPVPVYYKEGIPYLIEESELPLKLPAIDEYKPTTDGEPPLARATDWKYQGKYDYEQTTMPGWAGSSWYFLRYMDAQNQDTLVSKEASEYWNSVDLYIGGTEHATGHLLYSRFWNMFMFDKGIISNEEPFKKLVNQGMIQGRSQKIRTTPKPGMMTNVHHLRIDGNHVQLYSRSSDTAPLYISNDVKLNSSFKEVHVDISFTKELSDKQLGILDTEAFRNDPLKTNYLKHAIFVFKDKYYQNGKWYDFSNKEIQLEQPEIFYTKTEVEKMSKSKYNVVNPDTIIERFGADTLRLYEMFLGPLEQSKPWSTDGIEGVAKFLKKLWRLFYDNEGNLHITDEPATDQEQKIIHGTIKKVGEDIERLSLNTSVSAFMVCANELTSLKCRKKEVLENFLLILSSYAPHIAEELWHNALDKTASIFESSFPKVEEKYLKEDAHEYPIMMNGKMRTKIKFSLDKPNNEIQAEVIENEIVQKWLEGKTPKKIIVVPKKIINVVV